MNALIVAVAVAGWVATLVLAYKVIALRRGAKTREESLTQALVDAEDESAAAGSMQHWLVGSLDQATDAIIVVDRIGREVVRNAAARRFEGVWHGEVLAEEGLTDVLQIALAGRSSERELQLYGPPRQVLQLTAYPLWNEGEVIGAVAFGRDISESRRVESVRRDFVANVSHELKTPIGALGLLAETMMSSDDKAVMEQLAERVVREADRLARMVDDLLDLSLIEAQEAPTREPLPVSLLIADAVDYVQAAADTAGVPLRIFPRPPAVEITCDPRQMRSALANLLDNAIKYSGPGKCVEIGAHLSADRVAIAVRDHGIGIPTRDMERIFERFYRVDRARSRDTGGTGLGLSIVRHVAQAHGGEVSVESREGEGSTFTLFLPIANGALESVATEAS